MPSSLRLKIFALKWKRFQKTSIGRYYEEKSKKAHRLGVSIDVLGSGGLPIWGK